MNEPRPLRIGIVAGESSGDTIAAGLLEALRERVPHAQFEGVAGPRMQEAGCRSLFPMERLAVMGLVEVLKHLPGLLQMRRALRRHFLASPPDLFIGVDAPDFNLGLERMLKRRGIRTLHYVSPSVWAWRRYRVRKISRSVDCMLTLFPFEERFYREHHVPARCVGHPLADLIAGDVTTGAARAHLQLRHQGPLLALLPGSRVGEVKRHIEVFLAAAAWCHVRCAELRIVVPAVNAACGELVSAALVAWPGLPVTVLQARGTEVMAAADAVLLASGTATLECMLLNRPMVVAYRLSELTYRIARRLVRAPYIALPNLLAGKPLVKEFIQHEVTAERLGSELLALLENPAHAAAQAREFSAIHDELRRDASHRAADIVLRMTGYPDGD